MRHRVLFLPMLMGLALAACGGTATPTAEQFTPSQVPATMAAPTQAAAAPTQAAAAPADSSMTTYQLVPDQSTASFTIDEVLMGQPNTVVGTSHALQGSFSLDLNDPAGAQYGAVEIKADSFVTDDDRRNGVIRRLILRTDDPANAMVTFQPQSVDGLPASAEVGTPIAVSVTGALTIHGITQSVTFEGQVTAASASEIHGSLSATVPRSDFDLNIPNVPFVANVQDTVLLKLDFVATAG